VEKILRGAKVIVKIAKWENGFKEDRFEISNLIPPQEGSNPNT
jgi:hypothetical protein